MAEPIRLTAGTTVRLPVPGVTAAFSLNSQYAEATSGEDVIIVSGLRPGSTNVVAVTAVGTQTFEVVVLEPPPKYPPGFQRAGSLATAAEAVSYEFRYSSVPSQQQNVLDVVRREDARATRFHVANVNLLAGELSAVGSRVRFPSVFLEVKTARRQFTFLDQQVMASPLTVESALVRGFHLRDQRWTFHGGYSSLSAFQNLFLPADREAVLGATYEHPLSAQSRLSASLYAFPSRNAGSAGIRRGAVGSLLYEYKRADDWTILAEAGASHGAGFAFRAEKSKGKSQFRTSLRYKASEFAGLSTDNSRGLAADGLWHLPLSRRFDLRATYYANRYMLPVFRQTNLGTTWMVKYEPSRHWIFSGGIQYGYLKPDLPPGPSVESKSLPLGVDFKSRFLSAGYQHVLTRNTGQNLGGQQDRVTVGTGWGRWRLAGHFDRQTQAPSASFIVSQTPGLQDVIDRLGLAATTAEQIAKLVQQDSVLLQLGYLSGIRINLAPVRKQFGGNLVWARAGRLAPQVTATFLHDDNQSVIGNSRSDIATLSFSCRLTSNLDLFASSSQFRLSIPGISQQRRTQFDISLRRSFGRIPRWLLPTRRGTISGRVFQDDERESESQAKAKGLADVLVVLDGTRETRTDADGRFTFTGVPAGEHEVEVRYQSDRPFYFSTPSRRRVDRNAQADFGIVFARSMLVGRVVNDGGTGIHSIQVTISGAGRTWDTATDGEGKFSVPGLAAGEYEVTLGADSFPPGYMLADLATERAQVRVDQPGRVEFKVKATRALAGTVTIYDRSVTRQVPVEGVVVRLRELNLQTTTDKDGAYVFRDLPAGPVTVVIVYNSQEFTRSEQLTAEPIFIRNADISLGAR